MSRELDYLIGADPEVFILNPNNQKFRGANGIIPGSKHFPQAVPKGALQVDGMAAEFNIDPAESCDAFIGNVSEVYGLLKQIVSDAGYRVVAEPVAVFDKGYWDTDVDMGEKELGCDPDYNAWTGQANQINQSMAEEPMRTASGHIHIGWTKGVDTRSEVHFLECCARAKQLDYYLGVESLKWDSDGRRRSLYGKAGAFRPKPYGLEYRVLSNVWLNSQMLQRWIYHTTLKAMKDFDSGDVVEIEYGDMAQNIIDQNIIDWYEHFDFKTGVTEPPLIKAAA